MFKIFEEKDRVKNRPSQKSRAETKICIAIAKVANDYSCLFVLSCIWQLMKSQGSAEKSTGVLCVHRHMYSGNWISSLNFILNKIENRAYSEISYPKVRYKAYASM
jgi:hypothetical protein